MRAARRLAPGEQFCCLSLRPWITVIAMYQPDHYRVEDVAQMHALMRARPFVALVSCGSRGLYADHLPTVLKGDGPYLIASRMLRKCTR
jgi:Putative FMN-binding domain